MLAKTKITGPGKKVQKLRVWLNVFSWLRHQHWLQVGYDIWKRLGRESGLHERDFGLPCPNRDLSGFVRRMANYGMASKCLQAIFNDLNCEYEGSVVLRLSVGAALVWTERSERAAIRTWAENQPRSELTRRMNAPGGPTSLGPRRRLRHLPATKEGDEMSSTRRPSFRLRRPAGGDGHTRRGNIQIDKLRSFGTGPVPKRVRLTLHGPVFESDDETGTKGPYRKAPTHGTYVLSIVGRGQTKTLHRIIGECHRARWTLQSF